VYSNTARAGQNDLVSGQPVEEPHGAKFASPLKQSPTAGENSRKLWRTSVLARLRFDRHRADPPPDDDKEVSPSRSAAPGPVSHTSTPKDTEDTVHLLNLPLNQSRQRFALRPPAPRVLAALRAAPPDGRSSVQPTVY